MKKQEELIKSPGYWIARLQMDLYQQFHEYMKKNDLNQSQLAALLGVTKGYISQILNGEFNYRIGTLIELSLAIGKVPVIEFKDVKDLVGTANESGIKANDQFKNKRKTHHPTTSSPHHPITSSPHT